jgi:hypothetical protein
VLSANPELKSADVKEIIKTTARRIGPDTEYRNGHSTKFGFGCADAESAVKEALRLAPRIADAGAGRVREISRAAVGAAVEARGALPNLFDSMIGEALAAPNATAESVAAAIASSPLFLKAVKSGMAYVPPSTGLPTKAQMTRTKLAKAFSAPTEGMMF